MQNDKSNLAIDLSQAVMIRSVMGDEISIQVMKTAADKCTLRVKYPEDSALNVEAAPDAKN